MLDIEYVIAKTFEVKFTTIWKNYEKFKLKQCFKNPNERWSWLSGWSRWSRWSMLSRWSLVMFVGWIECLGGKGGLGGPSGQSAQDHQPR